MSDRELVRYQEDVIDGGAVFTLTIDRSASGEPTLLMTMSVRSVDGSLRPQGLTLVIDDADTVLEPAIAWLKEARLKKEGGTRMQFPYKITEVYQHSEVVYYNRTGQEIGRERYRDDQRLSSSEPQPLTEQETENLGPMLGGGA